MCTCALPARVCALSVYCNQRPEEGIGFPLGLELYPDVKCCGGAGNPIWVFWKRVGALRYRDISLALRIHLITYWGDGGVG